MHALNFKIFTVCLGKLRWFSVLVRIHKHKKFVPLVIIVNSVKCNLFADLFLSHACLYLMRSLFPSSSLVLPPLLWDICTLSEGVLL